MIELLLTGAKAIALLALAAYLMRIRPERPEKPHPCDGCKHLGKVIGRGRKRTWICKRVPYYHDEYDRNLKYCCHYEPRTEDEVEGGEDDE